MTSPQVDPRSEPLVSIVTPSFNQGDLIRSTIESVLRQDYPRVEYIIRDGGSTDETARIASEYAGRLTFVSEADAGQSDAINKGFRQAKGSIVAWLNSDDTLLPGAIRTAVRAMSLNPEAGAVYGNGYLIDQDGVVMSRFPYTRSPDLWRLLHLSDFILQQTVFFRRSALAAVGFLDEALHWTMDWDILIRLGLRYPLVPVREFLGCLRIHPKTKTGSGGMRRILEIRQMLRRHGAGPIPPAFVAYGIGAAAEAIDHPIARWTPRPFSRAGEALREVVRKGASWASWRLTNGRQGHWDDGWVAPVASFILPPGSGPLLMEGSVPGWLPPPGGLELQLTVEGRDCGSHWLPAGDFRLEVPLPADVPETAARMTIKASRFLSPSRLGRSAERRRLAYQVRSIRRERESGGGEGSDAEAQSEPLLELPSGGRLLLVHTGGLGDLVLSSELIAGLKRERGLVVTLVCRAAVAAVPALFPVPPDRVVPIDFDPHTWSVPSPELFSVLEPVLEELRHLPSDAVVDGALRPTWFGWLATAVVGARSFLACGDSPEPGPLLDQVLDHFGLPRPLRTGPDSDPEIHERKRYRLLLRALGCQDAASDFPWRRPPGSETQTRRFLRDAGIEPGTYVACFPGGAGFRSSSWATPPSGWSWRGSRRPSADAPPGWPSSREPRRRSPFSPASWPRRGSTWGTTPGRCTWPRRTGCRGSGSTGAAAGGRAMPRGPPGRSASITLSLATGADGTASWATASASRAFRPRPCSTPWTSSSPGGTAARSRARSTSCATPSSGWWPTRAPGTSRPRRTGQRGST